MKNEFDEIRERVNALNSQLDDASARLDKHGVLDGEERLRARDAAIEIAKIREQIAHFTDPDMERRSMDAANLKALQTQLDYWIAQIDREFKVDPD